jgi:hypothetical protein
VYLSTLRFRVASFCFSLQENGRNIGKMAGESELEGRLSHFSSEPERPEVIISSTTYPALTDGPVVGWEEPEEKDPENPLNWPARTKWANVLMISAITFLV